MIAVLDKIVDGRTDVVFDYLSQGYPATAKDKNGVPLIKWCAYYGDVSAIRYLLANGESLAALAGELNAAEFHGHWRLCQFLSENGASVNQTEADTGETPLHAALCKASASHDRVVRVLLANGADPNAKTKVGVETGAFMRDCRTKGETPLHRAAACGSAEAVQLLLDAGCGERCPGCKWRFSSDLGKLAPAPGLDSQKVMLWPSFHQRESHTDGHQSPRRATYI
jgi:uncharacterized protein